MVKRSRDEAGHFVGPAVKKRLVSTSRKRRKDRDIFDVVEERAFKRLKAKQMSRKRSRGELPAMEAALGAAAFKRGRPMPPSRKRGREVTDDRAVKRARSDAAAVEDDEPYYQFDEPVYNIPSRPATPRGPSPPPAPRQPKMATFTTKGGKQVSFEVKGIRRRQLWRRRVVGEAKCVVNPGTGRAVVEGSRTYKQAVKRYPDLRGHQRAQ